MRGQGLPGCVLAFHGSDSMLWGNEGVSLLFPEGYALATKSCLQTARQNQGIAGLVRRFRPWRRTVHSPERARRERGRPRRVRSRLKLSNDTAAWQRVRPHEAHKDRVRTSQACGRRARRGSPDPAANLGWTHLATSGRPDELTPPKGVADDGSSVGRDAPLDSFKDTSPDSTPAFLPPEHEGRSAVPTHSLSGGLVPPISMQGPPGMTCRQLLARDAAPRPVCKERLTSA